MARKESTLPPREALVVSATERGGGLSWIPRTLLLVVIRLYNARTISGTLSENAQITIMEADLGLAPLSRGQQAA